MKRWFAVLLLLFAGCIVPQAEPRTFDEWMGEHVKVCGQCAEVHRTMRGSMCDVAIAAWLELPSGPHWPRDDQSRRQPSEMERLTEQYGANYIMERDLHTGETVGYARLQREGYVWQSTGTRETTRVSRRGNAQIISQIEREVAAEMKLGVRRV